LVVPAADGVLANDQDTDGDTLTAQLVSGTGSAGLSLAANGGFTYTPAAGFSGEDTFTYNVDWETTLTVPAPGVLSNDTDPDGDPLTVTVVDDVEHGELKLATDGRFKYEPDDGFSGTDTFTYTASDGQLTSAPATVTITVAEEDATP